MFENVARGERDGTREASTRERRGRETRLRKALAGRVRISLGHTKPPQGSTLTCFVCDRVLPRTTCSSFPALALTTPTRPLIHLLLNHLSFWMTQTTPLARCPRLSPNGTGKRITRPTSRFGGTLSASVFARKPLSLCAIATHVKPRQTRARQPLPPLLATLRDSLQVRGQAQRHC